MGKSKTVNFDEAYERIQAATGCNTQMELAELFGVGQSTISDAKRRGNVPDSWMVFLADRFNVRPSYILTGNGPQTF